MKNRNSIEIKIMIQAYIDYMKKAKNDEWYTPKYAVLPLLKYLDKDKIIWAPFDNKNSNYVKVFKRNGFKVIYSHKEQGKDFFEYEPRKWDIIVSNPPFSIKDKVLKRVYELKKPFILLLPLSALQSKRRGKLFNKYGIQLISFDKRIGYNHMEGNSFASAYFCWKILKKDLIYENLNKSNG